MNIKKAMSAAAVCCGAMLALAADEVAEAEKGEIEESKPIVSIEAGAAIDSRYMTYGVVDGRDPILTPSAQITFFDWVYLGVESIFDLSKANGHLGGYGNRSCRWTTLDSIGGLAHEFELTEDLALSVDVNYIYEYMHRHHDTVDDTQYINLELGLTGCWIEPTLAYERDIMADNGTYVNFSLAHTFALVGDEEDPTLTFTPSIGQGIGDKHRTRGYDLARDHGGLMDTTLKGEFEWSICEHVALTAYAAYSDYLFDNKLRRGAREYNSAWGSCCDHSWNFYGGIGITVSF